MMTKEQVLERIAMVEDVSVYEGMDGIVRITVEDFEGFDDHWSEIMVDYDEEAVEELQEWLEEQAVSVDDDYYTDYHFEGFSVRLGYASDDI